VHPSILNHLIIYSLLEKQSQSNKYFIFFSNDCNSNENKKQQEKSSLEISFHSLLVHYLRHFVKGIDLKADVGKETKGSKRIREESSFFFFESKACMVG